MKNAPERIMVVGCSGSGKSTLTRQLAERTGLPVIHLDENYFGPGWEEPTPKAWTTTVKQLAARDRWIMDGNYSGTFSQRLPRADMIIFVDQPAWRCLYRVVKRTLRYWGRVRPGSAPGCRERFDGHFLHYVAMYNRTRRPGIIRMLRAQERMGKTVFHLAGNSAVKDFMADLQL